MSLRDRFAVLVPELIRRGKEEISVEPAGGISKRIVFRIFGNMIDEAVQAAEQSVESLAVEKKQAVTEAAQRFVEEVIIPIDLPGPDWIYDPLTRKATPFLVEAAIEIAVAIFKRRSIGNFAQTA